MVALETMAGVRGEIYMANMCLYVGIVVVMLVRGGGVIIWIRRGSIPFRRFVSELRNNLVPVTFVECTVCLGSKINMLDVSQIKSGKNK